MMRALYRFLLRCYPPRVRREFGPEMLDVFDEARAAERARGPAALLSFYCRETTGLIAGLLTEERSMKHKRFIVQGCLAGLLIGTSFAVAYASRPYTSTAHLRITAPMIPESLVPAQTRVDLDQFLPNMVQTLTTRNRLATLIQKYNLYPVERARMPLDEVIAKMRSAIGIRASERDGIDIWFTYRDRSLAQEVTAEIVNQTLLDYTRDRTLIAVLSAQFLKDALQKVGAEWEKANAELRKAEIARRPVDRLHLDASIARQRYEVLSQKLADAEMLVALNERQQGQTLEVLEAASLPSASRSAAYAAAPIGALAGALLGWLLSVALARRAQASVEQPA